jgi:hypothetical protein
MIDPDDVVNATLPPMNLLLISSPLRSIEAASPAFLIEEAGAVRPHEGIQPFLCVARLDAQWKIEAVAVRK